MVQCEDLSMQCYLALLAKVYTGQPEGIKELLRLHAGMWGQPGLCLEVTRESCGTRDETGFKLMKVMYFNAYTISNPLL